MRIANAVLLIAVAGILFQTPGITQSAKGGFTLPTKLDTSTDHLLVRVEIHGSQFWCSLDTGFSAVMAIDRAESRKAGLVEAGGRPTPDGNAPYRGDGSVVANVIVGGATLQGQTIVIRDFPAGLDMDCVIGTGLLRQYIIEFDHSAPRVSLHEREGYTPPPGAVAVPLIFRTNPNVPFVHVGLELPDGTRQQYQTVFDTGTAYYAMALVAPASKGIRDRVAVARRPVFSQTGSGAVQLVAARARAVTVGPFRVEAPVIALVESSLGAVDDGTLGSGFLNRFTIGFDLIGRQAYLAPNGQFGSEQPFDASGVGFRRTDGGYEVEIVIPDSPAAREDLRVGDSLLRVDGAPAASLTQNQLRDKLSRPGVTCDLELMRMGRAIRVELKLERRL